MKIEKSLKGHISELTKIYNYYVRNTTVTFHLEELDEGQFETAFFHSGDRSGTYSVIIDGEIAGYCCISGFNPKEAYRRSAYVSIYLAPEHTGKGLGAEILKQLESTAYDMGIRSLVALICKENHSSASLFSKNGYRMAGELQKAGEKFGRLLDVVYYQKLL